METFSCYVPYQEIDNGWALLARIRAEVSEIRQQHPELEAYQLVDMGIVDRNTGIEVKLYFSPEKQEFFI
ncbi:hypothetical protein ULO1_16690 [Carboxydocella sp. ULO1]|nr:hypothetical protein ULO1_16690 [Carboxydocella sp. ULO1]